MCADQAVLSAQRTAAHHPPFPSEQGQIRVKFGGPLRGTIERLARDRFVAQRAKSFVLVERRLAAFVEAQARGGAKTR